MPTPTATLRVSVNGGAPTTGGITAAAGDTVQFSFANTTGWRNNCRLELSFPAGFTLPAGWSSETVGGHTVYYVLGNTTPPVITLGPWGKYMAKLIVNGGVATDESTAISVPSPGGLLDLGHREAGQFGGPAEGWAKDQRANLRVIESGLSDGGGGLTLVETYPTEAGQFYVAANGELWGFSAQQNLASPMMYELDNVRIWEGRLDASATSMSERVLSAGFLDPELTIFAWYVPEAGLVANSDDYAVIRVWSRPYGGDRVLQLSAPTLPIGEDFNATGDWTAFVPVTLGSFGGGSQQVPAGSILTWDITFGGSGVPVPTGKIFVQATRTAAIPPEE